MTLNIQLPENTIIKPQITVFGVGGAGGNATNNMIKENLEGVNFVVANTDAQALEYSTAKKKIQLGKGTTKGLGAGASPAVGAEAAEEAMDEILEHLQGSNMVFITAGMGGGTGTGAAPVIARAARELDILTVAVVTKPFHFEGPRRMRIAEEGLEELQKHVDTLIVIPNQNLFRVANEKTTFADAFTLADEVLHSGVRGITDLMVMPGLINLDYADVRSVMKDMGKAMMGTGQSEGEKRAYEAAVAAISNPLLDTASMQGARGVLINITGGSDMTLFEVDEAANRIREEVDPSANIIFGSTFNPEFDGKIRVSVVATGIDADSQDDYYSKPEKSSPKASSYEEIEDEEESEIEEISSDSVFQQIEEEVESAFEAADLDEEYFEAVKNLNEEYNNAKASSGHHSPSEGGNQYVQQRDPAVNNNAQADFQYNNRNAEYDRGQNRPQEQHIAEADKAEPQYEQSQNEEEQVSVQNLTANEDSYFNQVDNSRAQGDGSSFGFFGRMAKVAKSFQSDDRPTAANYAHNDFSVKSSTGNQDGQKNQERELALEGASGNSSDRGDPLDIPAFLRRKSE